MNDKHSICRYKDYLIKRMVKTKLLQLITAGIIDKTQDINLVINIDEQLTASNGYYSLRSSIKEELQYGISNFDYGTVKTPVFSSDVTVDVHYCHSDSNYMIQASDILANKVWGAVRNGNLQTINEIPNHVHLTFP